MDERVEDLTRRIGQDLFARVALARPIPFGPAWWDDRLMGLTMGNEAVKLQLFRFVDVLPQLETPADIVRLITLASPSHANVPSVLPWAYYLCTHMDVDDVLKNGVLTWESKALVLGGKEKLWEALKKHSHRMLFQFIPSPSCTSSCGCLT